MLLCLSSGRADVGNNLMWVGDRQVENHGAEGCAGGAHWHDDGVVRVRQDGVISFDMKPSQDSTTAGEREIWRLHGPTKVAVAVLDVRTPVPELRVFYEPESLTNLLTREYGDERALLTHATFVRDELVKHGWIELGPSGTSRRALPITATRVTAGVSIVAALAAIWSWRRTRDRK